MIDEIRLEEYLVSDGASKGRNKEAMLNSFQSERRVRLQYAVTRVLAESSSLIDATPKVLQAICIFGGWEYGELWQLVPEKKVLQSEGVWMAPKLAQTMPRDIGRKSSIRRGAGLAGSIVASGKPHWMSTSVEAADPYVSEMAKYGMKSLLASPVKTQSDVTGVLTLFTQEIRKPDHDQLELVQAIGNQIGDFIRRRHAEEALETRERLFRALFENSSDVVTLISREGMIRYITPSVQRIWGYKPEEFLGKNGFDFIHPEDRESTAALLATLLQKPDGTVRTEYRIRHKDGSWRWMEGVGTNLMHEAAVRAIVTNSRDITERKRAEEELRNLTEHLEHLVNLRTAELQAANKELEAFSYSVAHDLRAPVRAMDGFTRILSEQYGKLFDAEGNRLIQVIQTNTTKMGLLIDDLLAFSRISRQELEFTEFDMDKLVHSIVDEIRKGEPVRKVKFLIQSLPTVSGSYSMMQQVWINLISNAVKFTRDRESATVEIGHQSNPDGHLFFIKDTGIGFDMKHADRLFGVFQRLHPASQYEGTGVGLAIVQRIVHRHGGQIWAESSPDKGATFTFTLPQPKKDAFE